MRAVVRVTAPLPRFTRVARAALFALAAALVAFGGERPREVGERDREHEPEPEPRDDREPADDEDDDARDRDDKDGDEPSDDDDDDDDRDRALASTPGAKPRGGCPSNMARVGDSCVDRYEAPNRRRGKPLVMQTSAEAETWCALRKKRLCNEDEWIAACEGAQKRPYPYGTSHEDGRCNDDKVWRQVDEPALARWPDKEAKDHTISLYQAAPSGSKKGCKSDHGVYDLTGNVEEWVVRTRGHANNFHHILVGCYWSGCYGGGKPTCTSSNSAHGPGFRFYETGFRCCRDAKKKRARDAG